MLIEGHREYIFYYAGSWTLRDTESLGSQNLTWLQISTYYLILSHNHTFLLIYNLQANQGSLYSKIHLSYQEINYNKT